MSYLDALRLHFAGTFQAAVSTVNNDPRHYRNETFDKAAWRLGAGGSWNPWGDANWRLIGCRVTAARHGDDTPAAEGDPVLACLVADSDRRAAAKLADLDPENQLVSMIFGLEVRLCTADGADLVRGQFAPAAFMDIWDRAQGAGGAGDIAACAYYQSVLTDLEWGDVSGSPLLSELREAATDGLLSIRFNIDGYDMTFDSPTFTLGRVVGTIGAATAAEPRHFVAGRRFVAVRSGGGFFAPAGRVNHFPAIVDEAAGKLRLDLGNALPTTQPGGPLSDIGTVSLGVQDADGRVTPIPGTEIDYLDPQFNTRFAGVVALPAGRALTTAELDAIAEARLVLTVTGASGPAPPPTFEAPGGYYVRADEHVFRLDPGQTAPVRVHALRYGKPLVGARITVAGDDSQLQPQEIDESPSVLSYPDAVVTDDAGVAELPIEAGDPGNPRGFIDGQVYGIRPVLEAAFAPGEQPLLDEWEYVSLLVWDAFEPDDPPTWLGSLQPVFQQFANLYPVMSRFLDLSDYESVSANRDLLLLAFTLDTTDPNSMPTTRELSAAKRTAIVRWLQDVGPDGKPLRGTAPKAAAPPAPAPLADGPGMDIASALRGGKAAAAERRLVVRRAAQRAAR